jgi:hypothetical protein
MTARPERLARTGTTGPTQHAAIGPGRINVLKMEETVGMEPTVLMEARVPLAMIKVRSCLRM